MDSKSVGVAEVVANLSVGDEELKNAAERLARNRGKKQSGRSNKTVEQEKARLVDTGEIAEAENREPKKTTPTETLPKELGAPTATLNTRVPPEIDQFLDNLLAKQRRNWKSTGQKGAKPTKQTIIQDALERYFRARSKG